jgi:predicted adenylyl cyclase CyaB
MDHKFMKNMALRQNTMERRNLEFKACCADLAFARQAALALGAAAKAILQQTDTYFAVPRGRLKLRCIGRSQAQLIYYERPNDPSIRMSRYHLVQVHDSSAMIEALEAALGITAVVVKRRELLLWHNIRIHLDSVENLGNFVEFEAVLSADFDAEVSQRRLEQLIHALKIDPTDRVASSYADLIQSKTPR